MSHPDSWLQFLENFWSICIRVHAYDWTGELTDNVVEFMFVFGTACVRNLLRKTIIYKLEGRGACAGTDFFF